MNVSSGSRSTVPLLLVGVVAPAIVALGFVRRFGVNIPAHDEWLFVPTIRAFLEGDPWLGLVLARHKEHHNVPTKLFFLALARWGHYDVRLAMYASVLLMAIAALGCWWLLVRTEEPRLLIVPIGWLLISTAECEILLVGWQSAIPLANALTMLAICNLIGKRPRWLAAAIAAMAASFTFAGGMASWPAGALVLGVRRRWRAALGWGALAAMAAILYCVGDSPSGLSSNVRLIRGLKGPLLLFFTLLGNHFGAGDPWQGVLAGLVVAAVVLVSTYALWQAGALGEAMAPWYALLSYSTLGSLLVAIGRGFSWLSFATSTRYLGVSVFVPVAAVVIAAAAVRTIPAGRTRHLVVPLVEGLALIAAVQAVRTISVGWSTATADHGSKEQAVACLLTSRSAPVECLSRVYALDGEVVRAQAATLERHRLGPFAFPLDNATVRGSIDLVAGAAPAATNAVRADQPILVEGWALVGSRSPVAVVLRIDGADRVITRKLLPRPDVGLYFHTEVESCAWRLQVPARTLAVGDHRLEVAVIAVPNGAAVPLSAQVTLRVTVPPVP